MEKLLYEIRIKKLIEVLKEKEISGFITGLSPNMYYFTNFHNVQIERFLGFFVPSVGHPVFLVPQLYYDQICETTSIDTVIPWTELEDPSEKMASIIKEKKLSTSKIAVDDTLQISFLLSLQEKLPQVKFISGSKFVSVLRQIKSNYEKDLMFDIGNITDKVMQKAISSIQVGVSEWEISSVIENTFKEYGAKFGSSVPIVASGPYSAQPHYRNTEKAIVDGESVLIDIGGIRKYYRSDMTRTVFIGKPPEEYLKVYNIVRKAQETGVQSVKPGRTCEEIDQIVRKVIEEQGYGEYFIHRTGHGLGLEVREEPYIVEGNELVLEPGMAFSIEPGIYLPGKYGVRIEDCVIVTEKGAESFTNFTHNLITI
jgi:Xaa-Pro dipeptidase